MVFKTQTTRTQIRGATAFASAPAAQLPGFAAAWSSDGLLGVEGYGPL